MFQILDQNGNVVKDKISYETAMLHIDNCIGKYYIMRKIKED